eukprot:3596918-Pyramimonas_sp.AAC.1
MGQDARVAWERKQADRAALSETQRVHHDHMARQISEVFGGLSSKTSPVSHEEFERFMRAECDPDEKTPGAVSFCSPWRDDVIKNAIA